MAIDGISIVMFGAGVVLGGGVGWWLGGASARRKKARKSGGAEKLGPAAALAKKGAVTMAEASRSEVFILRVCKADVREHAIFPIVHHLKDVVTECGERGDFGHLLRVVLIDLGEWEVARNDSATLEHFARIHEACPHLPFWLTEDCLSHYLDCVHMGLQLRLRDDGKMLTWGAFRDDMLAKASAAIQRDVGPDCRQGLVADLMGKGMERVERAMAKLDPLAHPPEPVLAGKA